MVVQSNVRGWPTFTLNFINVFHLFFTGLIYYRDILDIQQIKCVFELSFRAQLGINVLSL